MRACLFMLAAIVLSIGVWWVLATALQRDSEWRIPPDVNQKRYPTPMKPSEIWGN